MPCSHDDEGEQSLLSPGIIRERRCFEEVDNPVADGDRVPGTLEREACSAAPGAMATFGVAPKAMIRAS